jgi:hypothetical protein
MPETLGPAATIKNMANNAINANAATTTDPILQNMGNGPAGFFNEQMQNANNAAMNTATNTAVNVVDNGIKSDVLGDWGKMGFDAKKAIEVFLHK